MCCELLGLSIDSNASHLAWVYDIYKTTGVTVPFPIVADRDAKIAMKYGMIAPNTSSTKTVRCVFIICPEGHIRAILTYPLTTGRNISEILRIVEALQMADKQKVATPAGWMPGQPVIVPAPTTYSELIDRVKNCSEYMCINWYLCFKNDMNSTMGSNSNMFCPDNMRLDDSNNTSINLKEIPSQKKNY